MRNQKGMSHIMLVLCIFVILAAIVGIIYISKKQIEKEKIENYQTNMLLVQGKVKIISKEATMKKNEEPFKGKKLEENLEESFVKELLEKGVISKEEKEFSKYYILENANIEEMGLEKVTLKEGFYIVNYETYEIIYSKGISVEKNMYYKLSQLKELSNKEETK